jgi:hypothetical protein
MKGLICLVPDIRLHAGIAVKASQIANMTVVKQAIVILSLQAI